MLCHEKIFRSKTAKRIDTSCVSSKLSMIRAFAFKGTGARKCISSSPSSRYQVHISPWKHKCHSKTHVSVMQMRIKNCRDIVAIILRGATFSRQQTKLSLVRIGPKSLKQSSLPGVHYDIHCIVTTNFTATIYSGDILFCFAKYRCNEVSLERFLGEISTFTNLCDVLLIYRW